MIRRTIALVLLVGLLAGSALVDAKEPLTVCTVAVA